MEPEDIPNEDLPQELIERFTRICGPIEKNVQHQRMLADAKIHAKNTKGTYREIEWEIDRPYGTHLCGYLHIDDEISKDTLDKMEQYSHGGFTSDLGFDCAHAGDYFCMHPLVPGFNITGTDTYKDYDYVLGCLMKMIDAYLDN
jgi:hypothetical protein